MKRLNLANNEFELKLDIILNSTPCISVFDPEPKCPSRGIGFDINTFFSEINKNGIEIMFPNENLLLFSSKPDILRDRLQQLNQQNKIYVTDQDLDLYANYYKSVKSHVTDYNLLYNEKLIIQQNCGPKMEKKMQFYNVGVDINILASLKVFIMNLYWIVSGFEIGSEIVFDKLTPYMLIKLLENGNKNLAKLFLKFFFVYFYHDISSYKIIEPNKKFTGVIEQSRKIKNDLKNKKYKNTKLAIYNNNCTKVIINDIEIVLNDKWNFFEIEPGVKFSIESSIPSIMFIADQWSEITLELVMPSIFYTKPLNSNPMYKSKNKYVVETISEFKKLTKKESKNFVCAVILEKLYSRSITPSELNDDDKCIYDYLLSQPEYPNSIVYFKRYHVNFLVHNKKKLMKDFVMLHETFSKVVDGKKINLWTNSKDRYDSWAKADEIDYNYGDVEYNLQSDEKFYYLPREHLSWICHDLVNCGKNSNIEAHRSDEDSHLNSVSAMIFVSDIGMMTKID